MSRKTKILQLLYECRSLLQLKYQSVADATDQLGGVPVIKDTFIGFQRYLYEEPGSIRGPGR
jgi:hypothetical protein